MYIPIAIIFHSILSVLVIINYMSSGEVKGFKFQVEGISKGKWNLIKGAALFLYGGLGMLLCLSVWPEAFEVFDVAFAFAFGLDVGTTIAGLCFVGKATCDFIRRLKISVVPEVEHPDTAAETVSQTKQNEA